MLAKLNIMQKDVCSYIHLLLKITILPSAMYLLLEKKVILSPKLKKTQFYDISYVKYQLLSHLFLFIYIKKKNIKSNLAGK